MKSYFIIVILASFSSCAVSNSAMEEKLPEARAGLSVMDDQGKYEGALKKPIRDRRVRRQNRKDPRMVYITFINKSGRPVRVLQTDFFGFAWPKFELRPNEPITYFQYPGSSWIVQDARTGTGFLLNGKRIFQVTWKMRGKTIDVRIKAPETFRQGHNAPPSLSSVLPVYLEVAVIADSTLVKHYGKNHVEEYVLSLFGIVSSIFKDQSLGIPVNIAVTDVYLSEKDPKFYKLKQNNAEVSARSACRFVQNIRHKRRSLSFDIGIVLTRKYIGPSGYAAMYTMCTSRSCALARENGFSSAYVIAHEIGHALGLEHDGEDAECVSDKTQGSIMAPKVYSKHDKFHWSKCSRKALSENIRYFKCLRNKPHKIHPNFKKVNSHLPGVLFPPEKQCKIYHGRSARACSKFAYRVCNYLWCRKRPWDDCTPMFWTAPVDGSPCFGTRWCVKGKCVSRTKPMPVNGNWGRWSSFGPCEGSCDMGIKSRVRACDNPRPSYAGKECEGKSTELRTCTLKHCRGGEIEQRKDHLCRENGAEWRSVDNKMLNAFITRQGVTCDFENDLCGWETEKDNKMTWTRHQGPTSSAGTGPDTDHTIKTASGHYVYVEASWVVTYNPYRKGDKASLISKRINFAEACFSFYFHMYGDDDCELRVKLKYEDGEREIWKKVGSQGKEWKRAVLQIKSMSPYQIRFVTIRGGSYKSDIGIDDIDIKYGTCNGKLGTCQVVCHSPATKGIKVMTTPNGLPCYNNNSFNRCYEGQCTKIGCDRRVGSDKVFDECGVCGGSGKTCSWFRGTKNIKVTEGKQDVIDIPTGTRDVIIRRKSNPETFLGIVATNPLVSDGFNHDNDRWPPGDYQILGNNFLYVRNATTEEIRSIGPLRNRIRVILFSPKRTGQSKSPSSERVLFQMRLARQPRNEFAWFHIGWNPCSSSCAEGYQTPVLECVNSVGRSVLDVFCEHLDKPIEKRPCVPKECVSRFVWVALNWTQCSATCGHGYQARRIMCLRRGRSYVNPHLCKDESPAKVRQCYAGPCPSYTLMPGPWDACSKQCNGGTQSRRVYCVNLRDSKVTDSLLLCGGEYPVSRRPCNLADCDWVSRDTPEM